MSWPRRRRETVKTNQFLFLWVNNFSNNDFCELDVKSTLISKWSPISLFLHEIIIYFFFFLHLKTELQHFCLTWFMIHISKLRSKHNNELRYYWMNQFHTYTLNSSKFRFYNILIASDKIFTLCLHASSKRREIIQLETSKHLKVYMISA